MIAQPKVNPYLSLLDIPPGYINIMSYASSGNSAIVLVQGSLRKCPGYFDSNSWSFEINQLMSIEQLTEKILSNPQNQRVTFSGGEPFWQAPALLEVAKKVKAAGLDVMAFTGFTREELKSPYAPARSKELLAELDLLIDAAYI